MVGAQNSSGLHGKTIRVLFADEIDRYPESAGKDGDVDHQKDSGYAHEGEAVEDVGLVH